jgi:protein-tyrosine-phosphatase
MPADPDGGPGAPFGVLFVCTGNICRSPTAEALAGLVAPVMSALVKTMAVGSAGPA